MCKIIKTLLSQDALNDRAELEHLRNRLDALIKKNGTESKSFSFPHDSFEEVMEFDKKLKGKQISMNALV